MEAALVDILALLAKGKCRSYALIHLALVLVI